MSSITVSFHEEAKAVKPNLLSKPSTYLAAVLIYGRKLKDPKVEGDFLWIKCNSKITVKTVLEQYYMARNVTNEDLVLKHESGFPDEGVSMKELDIHGDQFIAFQLLARFAPSCQPLGPRIQQAPTPNIPAEKPAGKENQPNTAVPSPSWVSDWSNKPSPLPQQKSLLANGPVLPSSSPSGHKFNPSYSHSTNVGQKISFSSVDGILRAAEIQNPPFARYLKKAYDNAGRLNNGSISYLQVYDLAWQTWVSFPPPRQAEFYESRQQSLANAQLHEGLTGHITLNSTGGRSLESPSAYQSPYLAAGVQLSGPPSRVKLEPEVESLMEPEIPTEDEPPPRNFQLQSLIADASIDVLEACVEKGVQFLEDLKKPMQNTSEMDPAAARWIEQINKLQKQAEKQTTVIGIVGGTGAGKSSVINAMLEQERLVPTNCMRACTSVVTEIQYNYSDSVYRAEIEFISVSDWEKELKTLFEDLLDGNGEVSRDCTNEDTEAGIAYAKIKAVYPKKTKEDIAKSSIQKMLQEVSHVLGSNRSIEENDSLLFYKKLQQFVDSKEKTTGKEKGQDKKEPKAMEFWPLIRVVRIYVKAEALETGAVLVDLPGVHDSNAARAAVAEGYMKQCTGLWIVAPITRAVDDKAAKNLLGETFKRQLKMDGGFNSVTFICSKTDDISIMEASDSLGLDDELTPAWKQSDDLERKKKSAEKKLEELKDLKATYGEVMADADEQLEAWEGLRDDVEDGKTVYAPTKDRKRKHGATQGQRKKQKTTSDDEGDRDYNDSVSDASPSEVEEDEVRDQRAPLTEDEVNDKITEIRNTKKEARKQRSELEQRIRKIREERSKFVQENDTVTAAIHHACISGRNNYSEGAIQQDFAQGIKELDQEIAAEEDEMNFNPENEVRDYNEVARSLPVFCVSSRAYSKLQGRNKKDPSVLGFKTKEETQIPQLIAHCKKLTVAGRTTAYKRFITNLSQLLNSMTLWATDRSDGNLTEGERAKEARYLENHLRKLETGLDELVDTSCAALKEVLTDQIEDHYGKATGAADDAASNTTSHWGHPVNRENRALGGYYWSTYKAICRRYGEFANAQGEHDWNAQLAEPMIKILAPGWERAFSRRIPAVMTLSIRNAAEVLRKFHETVEARARSVGMGTAGLHMLKQQLQVYEDQIKDLTSIITTSINTQQKEINRAFTPVIANAMTEAYDACIQERGTGSFARMKQHMTSHVDQDRHTMFNASTAQVQSQLAQMLKVVKNDMEVKIDEIYGSMCRDYRSVLGETEVSRHDVMPRWARMLRKEVLVVIEGAERTFKEAANIPLDDEQNAVKDKDTSKVPDESVSSHGEDQTELTLSGESSAGLPSNGNEDSDLSSNNSDGVGSSIGGNDGVSSSGT